MKEHLRLTPAYPVPACGKSGLRVQSKGIISGLSPKMFRAMPIEDQCIHCQRIYAQRKAAQAKAKAKESA